MTTIAYDLIFFLTSLYVLFKVIGFAIYEIKEMNNKVSGIAIISFSILVVIFANVMIIIN